MVSSITGSSSGISLTNATNAETKLGEDFGDFLTLLTTQLKHQDPTSPLESNEFTQQIVSFSNVEQSIATNKNLEQLIQLSQGSQINNAVSYIGKQVTADNSYADLINGSATFHYNLPENAARTSIVIRDAQGQSVFTTDGERDAGEHSYTWDGLDDNRNPLPSGQTYQIEVAAFDNNGRELATDLTTTGVVTGVNTVEGVTTLLFGDRSVSADKVRAVSLPEPPAESSES